MAEFGCYFLIPGAAQKGEQMPVMGTGTGLIWDKVSCTGKTLYTEIGQLLACTEEKSGYLNKEEATFMCWSMSQKGEVGTLQLLPHATWLTYPGTTQTH